MIRWLLVSGALLAAAASWFSDRGVESGIAVTIRSGSPEKRYIVETMTGGVCLIDFDNDGRLDVFLVNGTTLEAYRAGKPGFGHHLYRNLGGGRFDDVTARAGVGGDASWGMGCSVADFNNDGRPDLYVTQFGPNLLYENRGDGSFREVGRKAGVADPRWSTGSAWGDFDHDGWLDLYVANYIDYDLAHPPEPGSGDNCGFLSLTVACGPGGMKPAKHAFYRNRGDGTFADETNARGFDVPPYFGLGVCVSDYDNDGDLDVFVANDSMPNYLFQNQGKGTFREVALDSGVAFNDDGNAQAGMGTDFGDYDNDGRFDLILTTFANDTNTVFHNEGGGQFSDAATRTSQRDSYASMSWGAGFADFDNDGWKDIYVVNGHLYPQVDRLRNPMGYKQTDLFYRNLGGGRFRSESAVLRHSPHVGRGAAFGDLDNDGRVDIVISNLDDRPNVLMNERNSGNPWLMVRALSRHGGRDAIGARVTVTTEAGKQVGEVRGGCSYLSSNDPRVHFGMGSARRAKEVRVRWPGGSETVLPDVAAGQILTVNEPGGSF